ncbi:hypothetical protein ACIA6D_30750 [Streptomyces cacaoi]|uniref:maltokinase N-terminal cap-like domain-containing protein n=1 Tax=Streptomyces cacaoi TaxID=1898 RepID=UPI0037484E03
MEPLTERVPKQSWYTATPVLVKAGGFRLDDPDGEVGIEFMVVTDAAAQKSTILSGRGTGPGPGPGRDRHP